MVETRMRISTYFGVAQQSSGVRGRLMSAGYAALLVALFIHSTAGAQYAAPVIDPGFNFGYTLEDRFAGSASSDYAAQRIARLSNGDVVVAGMVPIAYGSAGRNLGLVRYDQTGGRVAWSDPTPTYASYLNRYISYPNNGVDNFIRVTGISVSGSRIYVQLDKSLGGGDVDSRIVAFSDAGQFIGEYGAFTTALSEYGAGIATYAYQFVPGVFNRRLIAVATYTNGGGRRVITIKRFAIASDGTLSVDTSFGPYANGANDIPFPDIACQQLTQCSGIVTDVAIVGTDTARPRVYLAAENVIDGVADLRPALVGIDGQTGNTLTDFGVGGVYFPSGFAVSMAATLPPRIAALAVDSGPDAGSDRIYAKWSGNSGGGEFALIQRFNAAPDTGSVALDTAFGYQGAWNLGCCLEAGGLAVEGDTVALVGNIRTILDDGNTKQYFYDPFVLLVHGEHNGFFLKHEALRADNGTRWGDLTWFDVIGAGTGDSSFIATGQLHDVASGTNTVQFGTLRYAAKYDVIFSNGFQ